MYATEEQLIAGLLNKEEAAYREAVRRYHATMKYVALTLTGEKIADEVVQEAWFSVLKALPKFQGRSTLKTWILRIVANEAKTRLRKENRMISLESLLEEDRDIADRFDAGGHWFKTPHEWKADSPEALLSSEELKNCIEKLIESLPGMQSATLSLREQQGYSLTEICNILEVSESNVRVLLHRARNRLFACIEHFQRTGDCRTGSQKVDRNLDPSIDGNTDRKVESQETAGTIYD